MNSILNNPYRITGLLVGASAREQSKQISRLKQYVSAQENPPQDDFCFPLIGKIDRTIENINGASSKLNLNSDKVNAALFWFYKGNPITDEPAFDYLKEGAFDQAFGIWENLTSSGEITKRNASAFNNLGTLCLSGVLAGLKDIESFYSRGISMKIKYLESDYAFEIQELAADETHNFTKKQLQIIFLNQIQTEIIAAGGVSIRKFVEIINKQSFVAKEVFLAEFVKNAIEQIENKIEQAKKKHEKEPESAGLCGKDLYNSTIEDIQLLKEILDPTNIKYITIADKVADEILQCSIVLFNHFHDSSVEVGELSLELNNLASSIAESTATKNRIEESFPIIEKYIKDRPQRSKISIAKKEIDQITNMIEEFQKQSDSFANAHSFINAAKPLIFNIKMKLGETDDFYLSLSSAVANNVLGMIVSIVNEAMSKRNAYVSYLNENALFRMPYLYEGRSVQPPAYSKEELSKVISDAWQVTTLLIPFDMTASQKTKFNSNKESLKNLHKELNKVVFFGDTPVQRAIVWFIGVVVLLILVGAIWGEDGIAAVFGIAAVIGAFALIGWLQGLRY